MAKLSQRQKAQKLALQGSVEAATQELAALERSGDLAANVSLAEIAAYQGNWQEVMQRVEVLFGTPDSMKTQNVYEDMALLLARAAEELGQWAEVLRIAKFARTRLSRRANDELRFATIRQLSRFAERNGQGAFFPAGDPEAVRKTEFEAAVEKSKDRVFDSPADRMNYLYALATAYAYPPAAIGIFDREKALPDSFEDVIFAASALAGAGRQQEAWRAVRSSLKLWWPVDLAQVLPVVLLVDEAIKPLMTPDRCAEVLRTPRGPMAEAA